MKSARPSVELFVMSFCPYGVQAENAMGPVVDLLGSKADIKIRFIATVNGATPDTVRSLHGLSEAKEDLRQLCIMRSGWEFAFGAASFALINPRIRRGCPTLPTFTMARAPGSSRTSPAPKGRSSTRPPASATATKG